MFGFNDMVKFLWSFLIVLPLVQIIHVSGHSFMALIFGGKGSLDIGMGKTLFKIGPIRIRAIYFIDSFCRFGELKTDNRFSHALVYAGGSLFNLITIFIVNLLIIHSVLKPNMFFISLSIFLRIMCFSPCCRFDIQRKNHQTGLRFTRCSATESATKSISNIQMFTASQIGKVTSTHIMKGENQHG